MTNSLRILTVAACCIVSTQLSAQQATGIAAPSDLRFAVPAAKLAAPAAQPAVASEKTDASRVEVPQAGPTQAASRAGIAPTNMPKPAQPASAMYEMNKGQNTALMVVGAAALVAGLVIGGDAGTLIAIGGAGLGLWGLYGYVK